MERMSGLTLVCVPVSGKVRTLCQLTSVGQDPTGSNVTFLPRTMSNAFEGPPTLSTPDGNILGALPSPLHKRQIDLRSDEQISMVYEIKRTVADIVDGRWNTVALQFPDDMLPDAPRVFELLNKSLRGSSGHAKSTAEDLLGNRTEKVKMYILADTSYGSCCVDELAAEHVNADVVVHYGRACLSPTARLPVIHIFTTQPLALDPLLCSFQDAFTNVDEKVILMADVPYTSHLPSISEKLKLLGYSNVFTTTIIHDPSSPLPNRTIPNEACSDAARLKHWRLFHISDPPGSLLLILSSRVSSIHIFPSGHNISGLQNQSLIASTTIALRRRYALLTSVNTVSVFGILINTLSVKNYLHIVEHVKRNIQEAGKKSYTFVVGKVNASKIANFSEIGGWVVIGCWESSLIDSKDFWKPVLTPFELNLALKKDGDRIWTGEWRSDFQSILNEPLAVSRGSENDPDLSTDGKSLGLGDGFGIEGFATELESVPPEFDLRTGRYVTDSRPLQRPTQLSSKAASYNEEPTSRSLVVRVKGDLAVIGGEASPGAEHLRAQRTWKGLGSDFEPKYAESETLPGATIEEGSRGIARGYAGQNGASKR